MEHLGDITKISGKDAPVVNVVIGGSPCQDLSVASGKRLGLAGARSGLFMEQIRIIKEMRKADENRGRKGTDIRPRFMVWESVPGAFSSNRGKDFAAVLEEAVRVIEPEAPPVPVPEKGWPTSGCLMGDGWSVAWRVLDAQFWGVPQRRRRIALVADFGGNAAPEILFERESLPGDPAAGGTARESIAGDAADCVGITNRGRRTGDVSETLRVCSHGALPMILGGVTTADVDPLQDTAICVQGNCIDRADTAGCNGKGWTEDVSYTLNTIDRHAVCIGNGQANQLRLSDKAGALTCVHDQQAVLCAAVDCHHGTENTEVNGTLQAKSNGGYSCNMQNVVRQKHCIRRLTPLECERLQGYPDFWTDIGAWTDSRGKTHKESTDAARYKALGNSIALPPWRYVLQKLSLCCGGDWTMASLFDGIGGFPLIWEQLNGAGACLWASEIEEFPIAVTKYHFGGK
jgi:DNA (cytosine-5)-methyltransferase 1